MAVTGCGTAATTTRSTGRRILPRRARRSTTRTTSNRHQPQAVRLRAAPGVRAAAAVRHRSGAAAGNAGSRCGAFLPRATPDARDVAEAARAADDDRRSTSALTARMPLAGRAAWRSSSSTPAAASRRSAGTARTRREDRFDGPSDQRRRFAAELLPGDRTDAGLTATGVRSVSVHDRRLRHERMADGVPADGRREGGGTFNHYLWYYGHRERRRAAGAAWRGRGAAIGPPATPGTTGLVELRGA